MLMSTAIFFVVVVALCWIAGYLVKWTLDASTSEAQKPSQVSEDTWSFLKAPVGSKPGFLLGFLERLLSFLAFSQGAHLLIVGWLALKLGSKWQTWSSIAKAPETHKELDDEQWLIVRRSLASWLSQRFLIGTLINVLLGWLIYVVARGATKALLD